MNRIFGVLSLLVVMYALLFTSDFQHATTWSNLNDVLGQQAFFGVLTLGVGVLIITGGIDLSIGSVVGLSAILFGVLMEDGVPPYAAAAAVLACGVVIGLVHAALVTGLKLQPFLVTLCGLFIYRGAARMIASEKTVGLQTALSAVRDQGNPEAFDRFKAQLEFLRKTLIGKPLDGELVFPMQAVVLLVLALVIGVLVHFSVYGRYWFAIGHNEQAARYAGVPTVRQKFFVYVLCSTLASLGGILVLLDYSSASPATAGETWELYAITGAVLGGCSLRGGEGTVPGMVLGAAVLPLLRNLISFVGNIPWVLERVKIDPVIPALVGLTLLFGTITDEFFRRRSKVRR
jgi:ribose transport system permease protein